jgi:hypothetical protein
MEYFICLFHSRYPHFTGEIGMFAYISRRAAMHNNYLVDETQSCFRSQFS